MRFPYEPFSDETFWEELREEKRIDVFEVMEDPTCLLKQYDIMRTRTFLSLFVGYIPGKLDLRLLTTNYDFDYSKATKCTKDFIKNLCRLDEDLKVMEPPISVRANDGEVRAQGLCIIPADEMIRCICF